MFASGIMGEGVAIIPADNYIYSPCDGVVSVVYGTKHAICLTSDDGIDVLIHIGIDTVRLDGKYFEEFVKVNDRVCKGDRILYFDKEKIEQEKLPTTVLMIVTNLKKSYISINYDNRYLNNGDIVIRIK